MAFFEAKKRILKTHFEITVWVSAVYKTGHFSRIWGSSSGCWLSHELWASICKDSFI